MDNPPNLSAEWNIYSDPEAAAVVFNSGLDIYLVPIDVTNTVKIGPQDTALWRKGAPQAIFAADLYDSLLQNESSHQMAIWDVTAAELMVKPIFCKFNDLKIDVTIEGDLIGQTNVIRKGTPNMHVCLDLAGGEIVRMLDFMLMRSQ
jgi:inosine-uridine nucleoside N-ribohydrolase